MTDIIVRDARPADLNFVRSSWLDSYSQSALGHAMGATLYYERWEPRISHILQRARTLIACLATDEDVILGYLVYEDHDEPIAHYIYVKRDLRRGGVATELLRGLARHPPPRRYFASHMTSDAKSVLVAKGLRVPYDPTLFLGAL